ncbi:peptidoglycan-binding protein [Nocardiopsis sp. NPDC058631]|uniref:peptidoglycan-binding domain-containing protein n=1 Tax=Nocardiopsis sp. NPDC058631 TaxID=3346566 RepID=UPI0036637423
MIGLKQGDKSEKVAYLQELLERAGHTPGKIDGDYGPKTVKAVLDCRKAQGSTADSGTPITGSAGAQIMTAFVKKVK